MHQKLGPGIRNCAVQIGMTGSAYWNTIVMISDYGDSAMQVAASKMTCRMIPIGHGISMLGDLELQDSGKCWVHQCR